MFSLDIMLFIMGVGHLFAHLLTIISAKVGIRSLKRWIPAFAGMTMAEWMTIPDIVLFTMLPN
jgi:hypothetical protein